MDCIYTAQDSPVENNQTNETEDYEVFHQNSHFVSALVLMPIICFIGICGNTVALIILNMKKMNTSTNVLLRYLAVADIMKLLNDCLFFAYAVLVRFDKRKANILIGNMYPFCHYLFNATVCITSWLTVSIAVERYISVCKPTLVKRLCTINRARFISIMTFVCMGLVTVPTALRYEGNLFCSKDNTSMYRIDASKLGRNETFYEVYQWAQNCLRSLIPLFLLIILNTCIIRTLSRNTFNKSKTHAAKNRITTMLLIVIVLFVICITPDAIMSTFLGFGYADESNLIRGIREITDMLLGLNSAVNFFIYCACSKAFRECFMECMVTSFTRSTLSLEYDERTFTKLSKGPVRPSTLANLKEVYETTEV